jgi:predicted acyltransferase
MFDGFWLNHVVGIGEIGAHASIVVAGILVAGALLAADTATIWTRTRFVLLAAAGFSAAALLLNGLYGISKNNATPSWCLWSCAVTSLLWLGFYFVTDVRLVKWIARPLGIAGQNVLLAYLLSEMLPSPLGMIHPFNNLAWHVFRCLAWAIILLLLTAGLNRVGFRLRL